MLRETQKNNIIIGDCLENGNYNIHSEFSRVVNFQNEKGKLCFVAESADFASPNGILLSEIPIHDIYLLKISDHSLQINTACFSRSECQIYDSCLALSSEQALLLKNRIQNIAWEYLELFPEKSLAFILNGELQKHFTTSFEKAFIENALEAAAFIETGEIIKGIKKIKGTGFGLTPSGDDFIAGFLLGILINEIIAKKKSSLLIEEIYKAAQGKNPFTNTFLFFAKNGKYTFRLKNLVTLLSQKKIDPPDAALQILFSAGATSGADLLTGYIFSIKNAVGI